MSRTFPRVSCGRSNGTIASSHSWQAAKRTSLRATPSRRHVAGTRPRLLVGAARLEREPPYNIAMPATSSFDVTSPVNFQEVDNALNQARKEIAQRYDFRGARAEIDLNTTDKTLTLVTDDEFKMSAVWEI